MKILHVLDHSIPLHSGYTFRTRAILEEQRKLGWTTEHITSPKHNLAAKDVGYEEVIDGLHFYRTQASKGLLAKLPVFNQLAIVSQLEKRLQEVVTKFIPDIIHAHSPMLNGRAAVNIGKKNGIPIVYEIRAFWEDAAVDHGTTTENSLRYRVTRNMETKVIKEVDAVTTICEGLKRDLLERGVSPLKITIIPNAVNAEKFTFNSSPNQKLKTSLGLDNKKVIGFIGSFYAYEGIHLIVEALPELIKRHPDLRLLLVGGGPEERKISNRIHQLDVSKYVVMTGRVSHDIVTDYYNLIDVFVYPRLPMRLTELVTPLKPLEAMAQGKLVVASDVGGHKELIKSGVNGELFRAGDVASLMETIDALFVNTNSWDEMKNTGRLYVEDERNWQTSVGNYKSVYESLIQA